MTKPVKLTPNKLIIRIEDLPTIESLTINQGKFFNAYDSYDVHLLHGSAGTGKTFIAMYKALEDVLDKGTVYKKLIIMRSAHTTGKNIGATPGDEGEKSDPYQPVYDNMCSDMFGRPGIYSRLKEQKAIEFSLTTFTRGLTFDNTIIIVDEVQNLDYGEMYTIMTRLGINSKILFCGDTKQKDNKRSGIDKFRNILYNMSSVNIIEFTHDDIVRSDIVKEFIIEDEKHA